MTHAAEQHQDIRDAMRDLCAQFPAEYFRKIDERRGYPDEFVDALTKAGWLAAMIPEEYGGSGLGLTEASVIMEEINRSGGNCRRLPRPDVQHGHAAAARLGGAEARLPAAGSRSGELRLQSMGVTEPTTGTDTTKIKTTAVARATATSSTARRCGSRASSIPT